MNFLSKNKTDKTNKTSIFMLKLKSDEFIVDNDFKIFQSI